MADPTKRSTPETKRQLAAARAAAFRDRRGVLTPLQRALKPLGMSPDYSPEEQALVEQIQRAGRDIQALAAILNATVTARLAQEVGLPRNAVALDVLAGKATFWHKAF